MEDKTPGQEAKDQTDDRIERENMISAASIICANDEIS